MYKHATYVIWQLTYDALIRYRRTCRAVSQRRHFRYWTVQIDYIRAGLGSAIIAIIILRASGRTFAGIGLCSSCNQPTYIKRTRYDKLSTEAYIPCCPDSVCEGTYIETFPYMAHGYDYRRTAAILTIYKREILVWRANLSGVAAFV